MNLGFARFVSFFPIAVVLVVTRSSSFLVHAIIDNLSYMSSTDGGIIYIYDGVEATTGNVETDINYLQINLQYLYEVGKNTSVILQGKDTFSTTFFDLDHLKPSSIGGISASVTTARTVIVPGGDVALNVYLMTGSGTLMNADESFDVSFFDVKFNIVLSNYQFCDDCPPQNNRNMEFLDPLREEDGVVDVATTDDDDGESGGGGRGEYIDVAFSVIGRTIRETGNIGRIRSDRLEFGLGSTISLILSTKVNIDGTWMDMPDGFPALDRVEDGVPVFVARFPRFTDTAFYDPLLTTSKEGQPTKAPSFEPSSMPTLSFSPTQSPAPSVSHSDEPTSKPTAMPTSAPSYSPTNELSSSPSTPIPSLSPSDEPTSSPSTRIPSSSPTAEPTSNPTAMSSSSPSTPIPSLFPTDEPSSSPSTQFPSSSPTDEPTSKPTAMPSPSPSSPILSSSPTNEPASQPSAILESGIPAGEGTRSNGPGPGGETPEEGPAAVAFEEEDGVVVTDYYPKGRRSADGSVCGDQSSDSSIVITGWNTFEDTVNTGGNEVIWDTVDSTMSDEVEFHLFPSNRDNAAGIYDIDFTSTSITYTLREINSADTNHVIVPRGSFDRYYFEFKGKTVTDVTLVRDGTTITSTVQLLPPGFAAAYVVDPMETGIVMPALVNGGILVSIVPGAHITEVGQTIVICFSLEDVEEESTTVNLELEDSDRSSSSPLHSFFCGSIGTTMIVAGIVTAYIY